MWKCNSSPLSVGLLYTFVSNRNPFLIISIPRKARLPFSWSSIVKSIEGRVLFNVANNAGAVSTSDITRISGRRPSCFLFPAVSWCNTSRSLPRRCPVANLNSPIRSDLVMLRLCSLLNQSCFKARSAMLLMVLPTCSSVKLKVKIYHTTSKCFNCLLPSLFLFCCLFAERGVRGHRLFA